MRTHCKGCDIELKPNERIRCSSCWFKYKTKKTEEMKIRFLNRPSEWNTYRLYTKPNSINRPEMNAIYIRKQNTWAHEYGKFKEAWVHIQEGHTIITEAQRVSDGQIIDVCCISGCGEVEIVNTNGDLERYAKEGRQVRQVK